MLFLWMLANEFEDLELNVLDLPVAMEYSFQLENGDQVFLCEQPSDCYSIK